jgi:hypothetical protein
MRRLILVALAAGAAVAMAGTESLAVPKGGKGCVIEIVDERGQVRETKTEPEGTKRGEFVCSGGVWLYSVGQDDFVKIPRLQVGPEGKTTAREFVRPARTRPLTLGQMADIDRAMRGARESGVFMRAVIAVDDGRKRTPEEVEALLHGKDATGAKILRTIERPDSAKSPEDLVNDLGPTEPVVVYFWSEIWDAITDAVNWVIDGIGGIIGEIWEHCSVGPSFPPDFGFDIDCSWQW